MLYGEETVECTSKVSIKSNFQTLFKGKKTLFHLPNDLIKLLNRITMVKSAKKPLKTMDFSVQGKLSFLTILKPGNEEDSRAK